MKTRLLTLIPFVLAALASRAQSFTNLYNFSAYNLSSVTNTDGANPRDGLVAGGGVLYGTTQNGGITDASAGTASVSWSITPAP